MYHSIRELSASTMVLFSTLYLNLIGSYWRKTLVTQKEPCDVHHDVTQSQQCEKSGRETWYQRMTWPLFDVSEFALYTYVSKWVISEFTHRLIMGRDHVTDPWPQLTCIKKPRQAKCEYPGDVNFWKLHLPGVGCLPLAAFRSCGILWPCGGLRMTSEISELTWPENEKCLNFSSLSQPAPISR